MILARSGRLRGGTTARDRLLGAAAVAVLAAVPAAAVTAPAAIAAAASPAASPGPAASPAVVRYYVVPRAGTAASQTLFAIAARTLGNGSRYLEIFDLNKGRLQPGGGRLASPRVIEAGWILLLPPDARGAGVRTGALPVVRLPATATPPGGPVAARSARPAVTAQAGHVPGVLFVLGALLLVMVLGILTVMARRSAGRRSRRRSAHARPSRKRARPPAVRGQPSGAWPGPDLAQPPGAAGPRPAGRPAGPPWQDHPSFPGAGEMYLAGFAGGPAGPGHAARVTAGGRPGEDFGWFQTPPALREPDTDSMVSDSIRLAERIIEEADDRATMIVTAAESEAEQLSRSASAQADSLLAGARHEVAELRATIAGLTTQLPGPVTAKPAAAPPRRAAKAAPATRPGVSPRRTPPARPDRPGRARSRQETAWRRMTAALAILAAVGLISGATEIGLHGLSFFVFRNTGAGAGNSRNLEENQGPGQRDAPGAHHEEKAAHGHHPGQRAPRQHG